MKQLITLTAILLTTLSVLSQTKEQDSLAVLLAYQTSDSLKVDTSIQLIKSLYDSGDYQKALSYIRNSEKLSSSLKYNEGTAEIKYYKALIYSQGDDYYNALDNYNRSLRLYQQLNDSLGIAKVNNSLGLVEIKRGNYNKGLRHSLSAIGIFESKNLRKELSLAYNNLAEAYFNTQQIDKSLEFNLKTLRVRKQLRDSVGMIESNKNIAKLYSIRKEHRKSIEYYETLLTLTDKVKHKTLMGEILPAIGEEYLRFNELEKATPYLLEALKINRSLDNKKGLLQTLNALAKLNYLNNKIRQSEYQLNEAFALTKQVDNDMLLLDNIGIRMKIDSIKGDYENAFNNQRMFHQLKRKIEKENAPTPLVLDDPLEELQITEEPITPTNTGSKNGKLSKKLLYCLYGLAAIAAILLISLIMMLINRNGRAKKIKELEDENKQFELQNTDILEQTRHLEDMNNVKDKLFSIVSHDLKDSITSIKAFLDLLKEDSISEEEFHSLIPELSENADNASNLLLNLLNWSKSQLQNLEPKPESFNIQDVFSDKIQLVDKKVKKKRIVLLDESVQGYVYADRSMVEIIIQNLLANAVKFSRVGDVITLSNRERNGNLLICVEDTGVGIPEENQKKLFNAGAITTRGTNDEKGTGLGLSIVKQLVEMNYGKIWIESEVGLGSKFFVELPRSKPKA